MRGYVLTWIATVFFLICSNLVMTAQQHRNPMHFILTAVLFAADYMLMQVMIAFERFPLAATVTIMIFITAAALYQLCIMIKWQHTHITPMSVKESIDNIPKGLCYYFPGGMPKLTNTAIEGLCREITGSALMDAEKFWETLCGGEYKNGVQCVQCGEMPVVHLKDGSVHSFRRNKLSLNGHDIYEIISSDVTEEYKTIEKLKEKQIIADAVNKRMRDLNRTITQMTIEKEVLNTKIRVHDDMGQMLLSAMQYLKNENMIDRNDLIKLWRKNIMLLENEHPESWQDSYADTLRSAALLGVSVHTDGILPETETARRIVNMAVTACVTNTLRHAEGNEIYIASSCSETEYMLVITNNGKIPDGEIREAGGLKNLRREIESIGGNMITESSPRFLLTVTIPAEGDRNGI